MKKAILLASALSLVGGSAVASSWGSFGSFDYSYQREYQRTTDYTRDRERERFFSFIRKLSNEWELDFCGCGDFWSKDCEQDGGGGGHGDTPEVPLPAAGFLLLGAMGGIASLKRRKK